MQQCKYCGALVIAGTCPSCHRNSVIQPAHLMSARLFEVNPYLKKRLEWHEQIRRNVLMPDLPFDPTRLPSEDLPPKILPVFKDLPKDENEKKRKDIETLQG